ncbi:MAG: hypothetical protein ACXWM7_01005 [Parachlamydiaceae bacterium]
MATELLGLKLTDVVNCTKNFVTMAGVGITSAAVAATVDFVLSQLAIKIFKLDLDSVVFKGIKFAAFAAGCATTFYLTPQMGLISLTAEKAFKLIAITAVIVGPTYYALSSAFKNASHNNQTLIQLAACALPIGGVAGYIGGKTLLVGGILGSLIGIYDSKAR